MDYTTFTSIFALHGAREKLLESKNQVVQKRDVDGMFHPSSFGYCARRLSYALIMQTPEHRISTKLRRIFAHGHAIHNMLQSWLTATCKDVISEMHDMYEIDVALEVSIRGTPVAEAHNMTGNADGLITVTHKETGEVTRIIYEAKSASSKSWDATSAPKPEHILQTAAYAKCLDAQYIIFEYYNKDQEQSKFFYRDYDEADWKSVESLLNKVMDFASRGELLPREGTWYECEGCPYYTECDPNAN